MQSWGHLAGRCLPLRVRAVIGQRPTAPRRFCGSALGVVLVALIPAALAQVREEAPEAVHIVTGLHRAPGHPTTQPIERSHVPVKDRVRPMRELQSIATGHQLAEVLTVA